jgi:hypothetical protein
MYIASYAKCQKSENFESYGCTLFLHFCKGNSHDLTYDLMVTRNCCIRIPLKKISPLHIVLTYIGSDHLSLMSAHKSKHFKTISSTEGYAPFVRAWR